MTVNELRNEYRGALRGLTYDNASPEAVRAAVEKIVAPERTPEAWVAAIKAVKMVCRRCAGTGAFITYVENGQPKGPGGICFRCEGRGMQTHEDGHRNRAFDRHYLYREAIGMMEGTAEPDEY